ncbi:pentatricopeptide repeat-containing protein At2g35130-like [Phragmites australis]|uniref:pentatricopeptide repeat-containing protein At2g35130-like n=1 Tax=Phragmites australis TaxID=29695 RepID=UPI002D77AB1A|nr:pentatricopeptide repeat-containing protein At2g35130-like [Phragmites australis]
MQEHGIPPSAAAYNAYLDGLLKARCTEKAFEVYQRMKKERCRTNTETYTLMINVYGKVWRVLVPWVCHRFIFKVKASA